MAKTFRTQGAGVSQTLHEIEDEKIPVYDTKADAEADLANLAEEQIVATKDTSTDYESELYNYVDAKLQTTEVDVPITGVSLTCKARKSGNTVTVEFIAAGSDLIVPHSAFATIGTLPAGYRPARLEEFTIGARVVSSTDNVATYPPRVTFGTDGNISIRAWNPSADVTLNSPYNAFTFLVDGSNNNFMSVNTLKDAKDYTDARAVRKYDYTMTGTDNVYNDIKALCNQLVALGANTYAGSFLRYARTYGYYNITVNRANNPVLLNGTVVVDNEQGRTDSYAVSRVNDDWKIMPTMLNNNIRAADCNIVINPGIYAIDNGTMNTPYSGCYGILESKGFMPDVPSDGAQWIYQEVLDTSGRKFVRHCINPNTLSPISSQWSPWEEEDVLSHDLVVANPGTIVGYLGQIKYFLANADWTKINSSVGYRREFVGSMELQGHWYGTYHLSNFGYNYKLMNGTIYGEGRPLRFSAWYDPNYPNGWRVNLSYNYTYIDISGQQHIGNLNEQLSTALNLLAPQTWEVQHCECCIEVLGYFYAMCTFDMRGNYASVYGTILSSNQDVNGQAFTADFETSRNYWSMHYTSKVFETAKTWVTTDSNGCVNLNSTMGIPSTAEIISVRAWNENEQGQPNADWMVITQTNSWSTWFAHVASWGGQSVGTTSLYMQVKYRIIVG